ncbi:MAG TPA: hypothetical protein VMT54_00530 [Candidatus Cybelea sp.]|nr:hypothetical protein [Candidatus Cybelea sp.]
MPGHKRSSLVAHLLRTQPIVTPKVALRPSALHPLMGHNAGPPLDDDDPLTDLGTAWQYFCWKKAHEEAWKTPPREVALRRLARAEELGMSYRDYTLVVLDTGRFL